MFIDISTITDRRGDNPLHFAARQNQLNSVKILCEHILKYGDGTSPEGSDFNKSYLKKWLNSQSNQDDSFTPLHFASFYGNYNMIEYLIE